MTRMKRIILTLVAGLGLLAPALVTGSTYAAVTISDYICKGAQLDPNSSGCSDTEISESGAQIQQVIKAGINLFSLAVGIIAVVMILIGGVKYITSQGDAGNVTGAKNTILYAVIGLIVVALAQTIVFFVLNTAATVS